MHRSWDTGRKRIFCLGHKHKISKQIHEPKLKGNESSNGEKHYCCLPWYAATLLRIVSISRAIQSFVLDPLQNRLPGKYCLIHLP